MRLENVTFDALDLRALALVRPAEQLQPHDPEGEHVAAGVHALADDLMALGIRLSVEGTFLLRAVTHLDVSEIDVERAAQAVAEAIVCLRGNLN